MNIRKRRRALGLSQEQLAEKARVGLTTLSEIERGVSGGWSTTREAIAKALGCKLEDLYRSIETEESAPEDLVEKLKKVAKQVWAEEAKAQEPLPRELAENLASRVPFEFLELIANGEKRDWNHLLRVVSAYSGKAQSAKTIKKKSK